MTSRAEEKNVGGPALGILEPRYTCHAYGALAERTLNVTAVGTYITKLCDNKFQQVPVRSETLTSSDSTTSAVDANEVIGRTVGTSESCMSTSMPESKAAVGGGHQQRDRHWDQAKTIHSA